MSKLNNEMEAKHLRIGNHVTYIDEGDSSNVILTLIGMCLDDSIWVEWTWEDGSNDNTDCNLEAIKGIRITEERLSEFGFKKDNKGNYWIDLQTHYLELMLSGYYCYPVYAQVPEMSHEKEQRVSTNRIEFVHELQNLFFAISGVELEIKQGVSACS